jgi:hypothetical protein
MPRAWLSPGSLFFFEDLLNERGRLTGLLLNIGG